MRAFAIVALAATVAAEALHPIAPVDIVARATGATSSPCSQVTEHVTITNTVTVTASPGVSAATSTESTSTTTVSKTTTQYTTVTKTVQHANSTSTYVPSSTGFPVGHNGTSSGVAHPTLSSTSTLPQFTGGAVAVKGGVSVAILLGVAAALV